MLQQVDRNEPVRRPRLYRVIPDTAHRRIEQDTLEAMIRAHRPHTKTRETGQGLAGQRQPFGFQRGAAGVRARHGQMWIGLPVTAIAASFIASECVGCAWQV